jgi:CRP-like cAMP-binding protein
MSDHELELVLDRASVQMLPPQTFLFHRFLESCRERYSLLASMPVEKRIHWALVRLASSFGQRQGDTTVINRRSLQKDIGDLASTTIFTVNRVLSGYERQHLLTKRRGKLCFLKAL